MREDLNKQLCERERLGHSMKYREYRHKRDYKNYLGEEGENLSPREGMKSRYGWNRKSFNENLNPLYGLIRKNVGRPWDTFYSELCEVFDTRSVINRHILQHLFQYVNTQCFVENGEIYSVERYGRAYEKISDSYYRYYVHPVTGVLTHNKDYKTFRQKNREAHARRAVEALKSRRVISETEELIKHEGIWYQIRLEKVPECRTVMVLGYKNRYHERYEPRIVTDIFGERVSRYYNGQNIYYAVAKKQLNHSEMKSHGVKND